MLVAQSATRRLDHRIAKAQARFLVGYFFFGFG